jgi:hypothetical protein
MGKSRGKRRATALWPVCACSKVRELYAAVQDTEQLADDIQDKQLGDSSRSLSRYVSATGAAGNLDPEVVSMHIEAMKMLGVMTSAHEAERKKLTDGLVAMVDKRLNTQIVNAELSAAS